MVALGDGGEGVGVGLARLWMCRNAPLKAMWRDAMSPVGDGGVREAAGARRGTSHAGAAQAHCT